MRSVTYSMGISLDGYIATLPAVRGNGRLASGGLAEEIERLRT